MEVIIRPLRKEDAVTSVKWRNDPEVFKYTGNTYNHTITLDMELSWISKVINNKNEYRCAILADSIYVGNIYLTDITKESAQYHIFLGEKSCWGKGVARKASQMILEYAFNVLNLDYVYLKVNKLNINALNLYRRLGFSFSEENDSWISMIINNDSYNLNKNLGDNH